MEEGYGYFVAEGDGVNSIYKDILSQILSRGVDVSPRGMSTVEIRPAMVILDNPRERLLTCPGRLINPFFQSLESLWILGGHGDLEFISNYLKNMEKYADGRDTFHAPYGVRMRAWNRHRDIRIAMGVRDQFVDCYRALLKDQNTRQACMTFWNPSFDHCAVETNDRPCNCFFQFLIRENKLDFTISNRSNDISYGLANTNVVQFSVILETMAMLLGIEVGREIHFINSLHVYLNEENRKINDRVLKADYEFNVYDHVKPNPFKMDFVDNPVADLDRELKLFFEFEKEIRKGNFIDERLSFNFLQDGLRLAKSFYWYKLGLFHQALEELSSVEDDALFVSCVEFIARKGFYTSCEEIVIQRFRGRLSTGIDEILHFVENH